MMLFGTNRSDRKLKKVYICNNILIAAKISIALYALSLIVLCFLFFKTNMLFMRSIYFLVILAITICFIWIYTKVYSPCKRIEKSIRDFNINYDSNLLKKMNVFYSEEIEKFFLNFLSLYENFVSIRTTNIHTEYWVLQNQINPHFLYNTLEAIRSDAFYEGVDNIADITEALATFFRYTISNLDSMVTLEAELSNSETYFSIQNYRFGDKINLRINIDEESSSALDCKVPKLTLQPIIENAVIHGLEPKQGKGTVAVDIMITTERLIIRITDDGIGMDEITLARLNERLDEYMLKGLASHTVRENGIGLFNVNSRIKLKFGEKYGLRINSIKNFGTCVELTFPLIKSKQVIV